MISQDQGNSSKAVPVEKLRGGDHACMAYADDEVLWQALTVYTWAGLAGGDRVLIVLDDDDLRDSEAVARMDGGGGRVESAWTNGQVELKRTSSFYFPDGVPDMERQLRTHNGEVMRARRDGWSGLRGAGDLNWAPARGWGTDQVMDFESSVGAVFADGGFTAICWYDRRRCNDFLVASAHEVHPIHIMDRLDAIDVVTVPDGAPAPTSVAVSTQGELTQNLDATLGKLLGHGTSRFELDLRDLSFMEARCATQLISFAASLPEGGRVTVRCGSVLALLLRGFGSDAVTQLRVIPEQES